MFPYVLIGLFIGAISAMEVARQFIQGKYGLLPYGENKTPLYPFYILGWFMSYPLHPHGKALIEPVLKKAEEEPEYAKLPEKVETYVRANYPSAVNDCAYHASKSLSEGFLKDVRFDLSDKPDLAGAPPISQFKEQFKTDDPVKFMADILIGAISRVEAGLPFYVSREGGFYTQFIDLIKSRSVIDAFFHAFYRQDKAFWSEYMRYQENHYAVETLVKEGELKKETAQLYIRLLGYTSFSTYFRSSVGIKIPQNKRFGGTWVLGLPGSGKTVVLRAMMKPDLDLVRDGRASVIVLDSKGQLSGQLRRLKRFGKGGDLEGKLALVEPSKDLAINPLDLAPTLQHTVQLLDYLFSMGLEASDKMGTLLAYVMLIMSKKPEATFADFFQVLVEGHEPFIEQVHQLRPSEQDFFLKASIPKGGKFVTEFSTYDETRNGLMWRIRKLVVKDAPLLGDMFTARKTMFRLGEQMDAGKVIVIDIAEGKLGAEGAEFFGRLMLAVLYAEAMQGREHKIPVYVYMDDCHEVIGRDPSVNRILTKCRSQNIALIMAHQKLGDIDSPKVRGALKDCAVRIGHPSGEAKELADDFRSTAADLHSLEEYQFALFVEGVFEKMLKVRAREEPDEWLPMGNAEFQELREEMRVAFSEKGEKRVPEPPSPIKTYDTEARERG